MYIDALLGVPALWDPPGRPSLPPLGCRCPWVGVLRARRTVVGTQRSAGGLAGTRPPAVTVWKSVLSSPLHVLTMTVVIKPTPGGASRAYSWGHQCVWELKVPLVFGGTHLGGRWARWEPCPRGHLPRLLGVVGCSRLCTVMGPHSPELLPRPPPQILGSRMQVGAC